MNEQDTHWFLLNARELAALAAIAVLLAAVTAAAVLRDTGFQQPRLVEQELPAARVNVNTATVAELTALPGIGERKAERIVAARTERALANVDELAAAAGGIPAKDRERLSAFVVFD